MDVGFDSIKAGKKLAKSPHPLIPIFLDLLIRSGKANNRKTIGRRRRTPEYIGEWITIIKIESMNNFHTLFHQQVFSHFDESIHNGLCIPSCTGNEDLPHNLLFFSLGWHYSGE